MYMYMYIYMCIYIYVYMYTYGIEESIWNQTGTRIWMTEKLATTDMLAQMSYLTGAFATEAVPSNCSNLAIRYNHTNYLNLTYSIN
jgi:hypothetical protein